jgi:site-specific DNA-methyltransferase (adenine-specific)
MRGIADGAVDVVLTDPPYLYLKNQKLDRPFEEERFFSEVKRVLKPDGFIVLFGRGTAFYRWNTRLDDLGFTFKEEVVWDKVYISSPLMAISRIHETVSISTKKNGSINRVKVPYLEMKGHDIAGIVRDIKRLKTCFKNTKSLNAVLAFLEANSRDKPDSCKPNNLSISSKITKENRCVSVQRSISEGMNEKSIIRADYKYNNKMFKYDVTGNKASAGEGDRATNVMQAVSLGMSEKSIIHQAREHYATIHPTQKPVRLLERLLALVSREGDLVLDPFCGSGSTAVACVNTGRRFIGFEIDKEYYDGGRARVMAALAAKQAEKQQTINF